MGPIDFEDAYKKRLVRRASYKKFGFNFEGERSFIIEQALPLDGNILEVGCGWGFFMTGLVERGYRVTGVDVSADDIAFAQWNIRRMGFAKMVDLRVTGGETLPFPEHAFNAVFLVNVLHHLGSPFKVVDETMRVTAPGGKIIISDFSEAGFELVEKVHALEGEKHPRTGVPLLDVKKYLIDKGMGVEHDRTRFQETLIAYMP